MSLAEQLQADLKSAMHSHDKQRLSTLRMLRAAIKNKEIEERKKDVGLGDEEVLLVIGREAKKRKDSIVEFEKAGRSELAAAEAEEFAILNEYLPTELSDEEIKRIVADGVREIEGADPKKFGELMKVIMPLLKNRASGDRVTKFAKEALND
ncbi:MAG: GatB/YqeY domain-containing protein [Patescibacteria group bacterium]